MALDFFVLVKREQLDQRLQETGVDDRRFVAGVDRDVSNTGGGREDEREIRGVKKTQERGQAVRFDDLELVFL